MAVTYSVIAPLAIVVNAEQGGRREYLYQGSPLPSYVTAEERKRLVDEGYVAASGSDEVVGVTPATSPDQLNPAMLVPPAKETSSQASPTPQQSAAKAAARKAEQDAEKAAAEKAAVEKAAVAAASSGSSSS